jgi:ferritin
MINKKVEAAMNKQIVNEIYSAYLYLAMSAYLESINYRGFAHWMRCQAEEEMVHAMKFYKHIVDRGGRVELGLIDNPPKSWDSPLAAIEAAYKHEVKVTGLINNIVAISDKEKDYASKGLLQWFIDEQIEEEQQTDEIVQDIKMLKGSGPGLVMLDKKLGKREGKELG